MNTWNQINASRRRKKSRVRSFETLETRRLPKASIAWTRGLNFSSGAPPLSRLSHGYVIIIHTLKILVRQNGTPFLSLQNAADVGSCCVFVRVLSRHPSSHSRAPALGVWAARSSAAKVRNRRRLQDSQLLQRWVSISHTSLTLEPTVVIGLKRPAACGHLHPFCSSKPILCTGQNWLQPAAPL